MPSWSRLRECGHRYRGRLYVRSESALGYRFLGLTERLQFCTTAAPVLRAASTPLKSSTSRSVL